MSDWKRNKNMPRPRTATSKRPEKHSRSRPPTKSVDIDVNDVMSRFGRGTTHYFISISNTIKERERKAMGMESSAGGGKQRPKEVVPGLRALRQKRAFMIN